MQFGFALPNIFTSITNPATLRTSAILAEDIGFASIWVADHTLEPVDNAHRLVQSEALLTLAYVAGVTQRVTLGTSVLVFPARSPLLAAKQIATLQHLFGRTVIVGAGAGWCEKEFGFLGVDFKRRGRLFDEYIDILRKLWTQPSPTHQGAYTFSDVIFTPKLDVPPQIWVGGRSESAVRRAAQRGDGYQPSVSDSDPATAAEVINRFSLAKQLRSATPERPFTLSLWLCVHTQQGASAVIDQISAYVAAGVEYPVIFFAHESNEEGEESKELLQSLETFGREVLPAFAR